MQVLTELVFSAVVVSIGEVQLLDSLTFFPILRPSLSSSSASSVVPNFMTRPLFTFIYDTHWNFLCIPSHPHCIASYGILHCLVYSSLALILLVISWRYEHWESLGAEDHGP